MAVPTNTHVKIKSLRLQNVLLLLIRDRRTVQMGVSIRRLPVGDDGFAVSQKRQSPSVPPGACPNPKEFAFVVFPAFGNADSEKADSESERDGYQKRQDDWPHD